MSEITSGITWRKFLQKPGAKAVCFSLDWLLAGCPSCDCCYWLVGSDDWAYCEGCGRGNSLAHGLGPSGSALWSLGPEHFYEVGLKNEQENQLLAQVDLSAEIFGQLCGRFIDVIKQEKQIKVLTWENFRSEKRCALCQGVKSLPNYLYSETDKWSLNGIWHCFGLK